MSKVIEAVKYMRIQKPYKLKLLKRAKVDATAEYWGLYNRDKTLSSHLIHIYLKNISDNPNERPLETLIIHELVHAWQEECGFTDNHGYSFKWMSAELEDVLKLPDIYIPGRDLE